MKTTRAEKALIGTDYNETDHPAICALVEFASQNSGLDFANYGERQSYRQEQRSITADFGRFRKALYLASVERVTDKDVINAAPHAFSGRLIWSPKQHTPATVEAGEAVREGDWSYCTGQYFPTEYRAAAATVLEAAIRNVRQSREPQTAKIETIAQLKELNAQNGGCWFEPSTMRFFGTKIESGIIAGKYFISSEQPPHCPRMFTVRTFDETGAVKTHGEHCKYRTRAEAARTIDSRRGYHGNKQESA